MKKRPYILTIAGFDPSSGAGLTADIKTFETLKVYGLAVCTANTIQNDMEFKKCHWTAVEVIKAQIEVLFDRFKIEYVKIGIIENWKVLNEIIEVVLAKNDQIKIILDPVLRSSSDFQFQKTNDQNQTSDMYFNQILNKIYLLTPNYHEIEMLYPEMTIEETLTHISSKTNVLLKGGHRKKSIGKDELFTMSGKRFVFNPKGKNNSEKHGSGCVLSSAITSYLALGFPVHKACYRAKRYIETVLSSNKTLLGYHSRS